MRRVVFGVGCAFLVASALAACSSSSPISTASKNASPTPVFPVPSKRFSSAALGVSFRYPAAWRAATPGVVMKDDDGTVGFRGRHGAVGLDVSFIRPAEHAPPFPFGNADSLDLSNQRSSTGDKVLHAGLVTMDDLRLVEIDSLGGALPGQVRWRFVQFSSAGMGGDLNTLRTSLVLLYVACPASQWSAQRATLMAVLTSMRFARPKG